MRIRVVIRKAEEGGYWAKVPALPGCFTQGGSLKQIRERIKEAIEAHICDELEEDAGDQP